MESATELLTPAELAERLQVPASWVYQHTKPSAQRPIPVLRVGRLLRFSWTDVEHWLRGERSAEHPAQHVN